MTRLLIRAGKRPDEGLDPFTVLSRNTTYSNVGNMLFQQAVFKTLSLPDHDCRATGFTMPDADRINDSCDVFVVPLANAFRPNYVSYLVAVTRTLRRLKVPVVVVGVGCQTDLDYDLDKLRPIDWAVKRFVAAVLDRSASIGVRGDCTADYLARLGFRDVDVIGCPSMFMDGPLLPEPRRPERFDAGTRLTVNVSAPNGMAAFTTGLERMGEVITRTVQHYADVEYVPQENRSLQDLLLLHCGSDPEHAAVADSAYRALRSAGRIRAFVDPRTWIGHLRDRDFVFGTRLHGSVAALLAGTPAHLVAHDSRTLELARHHEIPHTAIRDLAVEQDARELYERSDYEPMLRGHQKRFDAYTDFLRRNGLPNVFLDGDGGAAFEARLGAADLPPGVTPLPENEEVRLRLAWMDSHLAREPARAPAARAWPVRAGGRAQRTLRTWQARLLG